MSNPYDFYELSSGNYEFVTQNGIVYEVYFSDGEGYFESNTLFAQHVLSFGFAVKNNPINVLIADKRIRITITNILHKFFEKNKQGILFYVCDVNDGRQTNRMAKFDRWHKSSSSEIVNKHDLVIEYEGQTFCSSLLIRNDNPFSKKAEEELIQLKERIEKPL